MSEELMWSDRLKKSVPAHDIQDVARTINYFISAYKDDKHSDSYFFQLIGPNISGATAIDFMSLRAFLSESETDEYYTKYAKELQRMFTWYGVNSDLIIRLIDEALAYEASLKKPQSNVAKTKAPITTMDSDQTSKEEKKKSNWWIWLIVAGGVAYFATQD